MGSARLYRVLLPAHRPRSAEAAAEERLHVGLFYPPASEKRTNFNLVGVEFRRHVAAAKGEFGSGGEGVG